MVKGNISMENILINIELNKLYLIDFNDSKYFRKNK